MRGILEHLHQSEQALIVTDMEAGLEHLKRGTLEHAGVLLIVVEPYFKSLEAAGRIAELGRNLGVPAAYAVANKVRSPRDDQAIRDYCSTRGIELLVSVPFDADVAEAEWSGQAVIDSAPGAAAVHIVRELAQRLLDLDAAGHEERVAD